MLIKNFKNIFFASFFNLFNPENNRYPFLFYPFLNAKKLLLVACISPSVKRPLYS